MSAIFSSPQALTPVRARGLLPIGSLGIVEYLRQVGDPLFFTRVAHFMAESSWQPMMSAAQRRRQRRLRSWWRHEQQSIAAAPGHVTTPLSPTGTEEGQGRRGGFRVELCGEDLEASPSPGGRHRVLSDGRG